MTGARASFGVLLLCAGALVASAASAPSESLESNASPEKRQAPYDNNAGGYGDSGKDSYHQVMDFDVEHKVMRQRERVKSTLFCSFLPARIVISLCSHLRARFAFLWRVTLQS